MTEAEIMATRRTRKVSADGQTRERREMRQKKGALFIQQFEKEAQDRINDLVAKMEQTLGTVDRVFKVELMKMPPALQNTFMRDLLNDDISAGDVTIAIKNGSPEVHQPLTRKRSGKRVKKSDPAVNRLTASQKTAEPPKKATKKTGSLAPSRSTGNLGCATTKRSVTRVAKLSDQTAVMPSKHRMLSAGEEHDLWSAVGNAPHVVISTSQGEVVRLCEETMDEIDVGLIDDIAVQQIKNLVNLMNCLCKKARANSM